MNDNITSRHTGNGGNHCEDEAALLLYGELSFDDEERVESHLAACSDCRLVMEQQRELMATLDAVAVEPSAAMLRQARQNLFARLENEPVLESAVLAKTAPVHTGLWDRFVDFIAPTASPFRHAGVLRPAGAFALVAMGFMGARMAPGLLPNLAWAGAGGNSAASEMSVMDPGAAAKVRYAEQGSDGQVHLVLDETRQRTVSGRLDDENIRGLLLEAARDASDPGLRAETMEILALTDAGGRTVGDKGSANEASVAGDVKSALIYAVRMDENAGVRLKAMSGLKAFAGDPEVRQALSDVLLSDNNPAMRNQAIDMLMQGLSQGLDARDAKGSQGVAVRPDPRMAAMFEELMRREEKNPYVRQRSQMALELVNAVNER